MPHVISIANMKGGIGKTTTTQSMAGALALSGVRVAIVDVDVQASLLKWYKRSSAAFKVPFAVEAYPGAVLVDSVQELIDANQHDVILIDCPGGDSNVVARLLCLSTAVLVPVKPGPVDYDATLEFMKLIDQLGLSHLRTLLFLSIVPPDSEGREARERVQRHILQRSPFAELLETEVSRAVSLNKVLGSKQTIFQYDSNSKAAKEIMELTREVMKCLVAEKTTTVGNH